MPVARSGEESCQSTRTTRNGTQTLTFLECSVGATHHVKRCSKAPPPNEPPWACGNGTPWCVPETFYENNPKHQGMRRCSIVFRNLPVICMKTPQSGGLRRGCWIACQCRTASEETQGRLPPPPDPPIMLWASDSWRAAITASAESKSPAETFLTMAPIVSDMPAIIRSIIGPAMATIISI